MEMTAIHNVITVAALVLLYRSNRWISLPSFSQLFSFFYIFFILAGAYYLFYSNPGGYGRTLLIINASFLFFGAGSFFSATVNVFGREDIVSYRSRELSGRFKHVPAMMSLALLVFVSCLLAALYFRNGIPLFSLDIDLTRLEASRGGGYFFMGFTGILPLAVLLLMGRLYLREGRKPRLFFLLAFFLCVLFDVLSGYRAPLASLLLMLLLLHFYIKGRFTWKSILIGLSLFAVVFFGITYWKLNDTPDIIGFLGQVFLHRVILDNPLAVSLVADVIPQRIDFFLGKSYIMDFLSALPGPGISFGGWLFSQTPSQELFGLAMLTPTLVGEFYANFSLIGACLLMFGFGFALNNIYIKLLRSKKEAARLAFMIAVAFSLVNAAVLGLGTTVFTRLLVYSSAYVLFVFFYEMFNIVRRPS